MKLYKVFDKHLESPYQNFKYKLGKKYHCEDFDTSSEQCSRGFYAVDIEGLPYCFNIKRDVYEVEVWGKKVEIDQYKRRYENIEIVRKCTHKEIKELAMKLDDKLGYKLSEALVPFNPLTRKVNIKNEHIELLKQWDSVCDSVWDSVMNSVCDSVMNSVWDSVRVSVWNSVCASVCDRVRASVCDSVWDSVCDSVWDRFMNSVMNIVRAYYSSLFPGIKKWKYMDHPEGVNPFQPCIDLWYAGIVPSYDGTLWRLHSGKNADIIWEGKL